VLKNLTHRFLLSALFFALASSLFFMSLASFSMAQANDAEVKHSEITNKYFKVISTYTGIDSLQKKPILLNKNNVVLMIDHHRVPLEYKGEAKNKPYNNTYSYHTLDAIDVSDIKNPRFLKTLIKNNSTIYDIAVTNDEKQMFVAFGGSMEVYDITDINNIVLKDTIMLHNSFSLKLSYNNKLLFVSGCVDNNCDSTSVFKLTPSPKLLTELNTTGNFNITPSKDGKKIAYIGSKEESVVLSTLSSSFKITQLDSDSSPYNNRGSWKSSAGVAEMVFSNDGNTLYVAGASGGVIIYDVSENKLDKIQQTAGNHWGALFNNTGPVTSLEVLGDTLYIAGEARKKISDIPKIKRIKKAFNFYGVTIKASARKNMIMVYKLNRTNQPGPNYIAFMQPVKEEHRIQEIDN
jgi:hypothetical protein